MIGLLALAAAAAAQSQTVLTIDPRHRLVEGVATDGRRIWVSSVMDRAILECSSTCRNFAILPAGLYPLGISWDAQRKRLWIAADCPEVDPIPHCDRGALVALDGRGRLVARIVPKAPQFHPGDVSASPPGVFVSDSQYGVLYRLDTKSRHLSVLVPGVKNGSAQGSATTPDGKKLVLADYSLGIALVDLASGARTPLPGANGKPVQGLDGLTRCGSVYYSIDNGHAPARLVSFTIGDGRAVVGRPLGKATLPDPTQVVYDGGRLLIVANSGWSATEGVTATKAEAAIRREGAPIVAIPLSSDCKLK